MRVEKSARIQEAEASTQFPAADPGNADDIVRILDVETAREYGNRLKFILATTQGSLEALDRVCMVICPQQTTWSQRRQSLTATKRIAEFLMDPTYTNEIPWYTAERFRLPTDWIARMRTNIAAEIHNSLQSLYNTKTGFALEASIGEVVTQSGYEWEKGFVTIVDEKEVDVVVPGITLPHVLIMSSYNLTTASSQSQRAREQKAMYDQVHANTISV